MKRKIWFIFGIIISIFFILVITKITIPKKTSESQNNKTNVETTENQSNENEVQQSNETTETKPDPATESTSQSETNVPAETPLYEFSTPIKSRSQNRLNNIKITCKKINGITVENGEEFSFCQTVGKSTEEEGYKKADVIVNKQTIKSIGGGNCQVSSTLYNAVLGVNNLQVTERHPHGKKVNYVPEGKDAAIAHGSKDFKFINSTGQPIKIYADAENSKVTIKLTLLN